MDDLWSSEFEQMIELSFEKKLARYLEYINGNVIKLNISKLKADGCDIPEHIKELKYENYGTSSWHGGFEFCKIYQVDAFAVLLSDMISAQNEKLKI